MKLKTLGLERNGEVLRVRNRSLPYSKTGFETEIRMTFESMRSVYVGGRERITGFKQQVVVIDMAGKQTARVSPNPVFVILNDRH